MITVGVTGGIGSGKTILCDVWKSLGAYVLNADDLAKRLMVENQEIRERLISEFGGQAYRPDGSLNRAYLAEQAFGKGRVEKLNAIVHPHIPGAYRQLIEESEKLGYDVFVFEAALLLQNLRPDHLDYVVLVLADREKRIERVRERDDFDEEEVIDRMENQQNFDQLTDQADIVIENNGSLEEFRQKAEEVYQTITSGQKN